MLVLALNAGQGGAFAAVQDGKLLFSQEAEKDLHPRRAALGAHSVMNAVEHLAAVPDVIAYTGGWRDSGGTDGIGHLGADRIYERPMNFLGQHATLVETTHERSHIMSSIALAPRDDVSQRACLVWDGMLGKLYVVDARGVVQREIEVHDRPGARWALLFGIADPTFPDDGAYPRDSDAGNVMALAAQGDATEAGKDPLLSDIVDRVLVMQNVWPASKREFRDTPIHNAGAEADVTKAAAALLSRRLFEMFSKTAVEQLPPGLPLHISGGCGLNRVWNRRWRELGHFSSVFVGPCPNDAGLAIGGAADALRLLTGDPFLEWSVSAGLDFEWDADPKREGWQRRTLNLDAVAAAMAEGRIVAWVQGRAEIGPRALGNRSLLADPTRAGTGDRLNAIKRRAEYRPIPLVCRVEDLDDAFDSDFPDPHRAYARVVTTDRLGTAEAGGSAGCQTVTKKEDKRLHDLLSAVAERTGMGVLANMSLSPEDRGAVNKMSDLESYCRDRGIHDFVVADAWYWRQPVSGRGGPDRRRRS